jgi:HK97 family phage prohead protease
MRTKECKARVQKAGVADGLLEGQFIALVSVFGNEDSMGDVVLPGAFTTTLAEWSAKGDPLPVIWSHRWADPFSHIGTVTKAVETTEGLLVTGQIDDLGENETADQVYRLLKGRRVTQFSFAYDVVQEAWVRDDTERWGGYWELRELKLHEVGPCLVGANQETQLIAAKATTLARGVKAGRVLSQSNFDTLTSAYEAIGEVLAAATPEAAKARKGTTPEDTGQPGKPVADGTEPSAKPDTQPAKAVTGITDDELQARIAQAVTEALKGADTTSRTEDETTPDPAAADAAAKSGADSARLRTDLQLLELESSLTE